MENMIASAAIGLDGLLKFCSITYLPKLGYKKLYMKWSDEFEPFIGQEINKDFQLAYLKPEPDGQADQQSETTFMTLQSPLPAVSPDMLHSDKPVTSL